MNSTRIAATSAAQGTETPPVTLFVCSNCARAGEAPSSAGRPRPTPPEFGWPWPVRRVLVGCTGRLQPEHVLKAFESGASLVCAIGCAEDNCHYLEGSKRCSRRVGYIRSVLEAIGLGGERLMHFSLPGSATEDMALAAGRSPFKDESVDWEARTGAIREEVIRTLDGLPPNPLHRELVAGEAIQKLDISDDDNEE